MNIEAVNDYTACAAVGGNLTNSVTDAYQFQQAMMDYGPTAYRRGQVFYNADVYPSDFSDADSSGNTSDHDYLYFDKRGTAISWFTGHGVTSNGNWDQASWANPQTCYHDSECTDPYYIYRVLVSTYLPGFCRREYPGQVVGKCAYQAKVRAAQAGTCPVNGHTDGQVRYSTNMVRWGESTHSGTWASAGTNGGVNVVALAISAGSWGYREWELFPAFGGIHLLLTTMNHSQGDTANTANRGLYFAMRSQTATEAVQYSWLVSMASLPSTTNSTNACSGYDQFGNFVTLGGARGTNGCGGHMAVAMGATSAEVSSHLAEDWNAVRLDTNDGKGSAYFGSLHACNWDCFATNQTMNIP